MTELAAFAFDVDALGRGPITVNGVDVQDQVAAFTVTGRRGAELTSVVLHQPAGAARIEGRGIVHVVADDTDTTTVIRDWLETIDPDALEQAVLASVDGLDPPATVGDGWLRALKSMLDA